MFEDSTFESNGKIRTRSRGWMIATFALNTVILLALVLVPLIYTQALPHRDTSILMTVPPPESEPPVPAHAPPRAASTLAPALADPFMAPPRIPTIISTSSDPAPAGVIGDMPMDEAAATPGGIGAVFHQPAAPRVVHPGPKEPLRVSSTLAAGMLIQKVMPQYPPIARSVRLSGTVVLAATIDKSGRIANLHVMSGPAMLQQAALDAVSQWRYRPYLLNGEPVEVETSVNVVFSLGN